jgi:hypothetical protein
LQAAWSGYALALFTDGLTKTPRSLNVSRVRVIQDTILSRKNVVEIADRKAEDYMVLADAPCSNWIVSMCNDPQLRIETRLKLLAKLEPQASGAISWSLQATSRTR